MASKRIGLPPTQLPPSFDPVYRGASPYALSGLGRVCGTRINPYCVDLRAGEPAYIYDNPGDARSGDSLLTCAHGRDSGRSLLEAHLGDYGGFDPRCRFRQPPPSAWPLPAIIGRIEAGATPAMPLPAGAWMIDYRYLVYRDGTEKPWTANLRDRFAEGSFLILTFWGDQQLKRGLWTDSGFWQRPLLDQFDAVCVPPIHSHCDDPYPQMHAGDRKLQKLVEEGVAAGRLVIPSIAFTNEQHLRRQLDLWGSYKNPDGTPAPFTLMVDANGAGLSSPQTWRLRWLMALRDQFAPLRHGRFLISGLHQHESISELRRIFPDGNFHVVASLPRYLNSLGTALRPQTRADNYLTGLEQLADFYWGRLEKPLPVAYPERLPRLHEYDDAYPPPPAC
jgi:hypothetical protein